MPLLRKCSFATFLETVRGKNVYVWGASKRLKTQDIYRTPFTHLGPQVYKIVDNDESLWGHFIEIPFRGPVPVISPTKLCEEIRDCDIILIASAKSADIFSQMQSMPNLSAIYCYDLGSLNDSQDSQFDKKFWESSICSSEQIPPIIHYCWFGPKKIPDAYLKFIESWRKYCPSYEIQLWNEDNYDVSKHPYMKWAYDNKKWEFVSDYARLDLVYRQGGIYFDTDCEMIQNPDVLRKFPAFVGYESTQIIATGLGIGSVKGNRMIGLLLAEYDKVNVKQRDFDMTPCTLRVTHCLRQHGLKCDNSFQVLEKGELAVLPTEILCGIRLYTKEKQITERTISLHHWCGGWGINV